MSLSKIEFPEDNPFYRIKARQILLSIFMFFLLVVIWYYVFFILLNLITKINFNKNPDPIIGAFIGIVLFLLLSVWLWRQCNLVGIDVNRLIGKIPTNYQWLPLIGLLAARFAFSLGFFRIFYYFISFIAYSWVENDLQYNLTNNSLLNELSNTVSPALYLVSYLIFGLIALIYFIFLIFGVVLHRWSTKWTTKRTIVYLCILSAIFSLVAGSYTLTPVFYVFFNILLYLQTRTLIIVALTYFMDIAIGLIWDYLIPGKYDLSINLVEQLRDRLGIAIIFVAVSTPFLIRFIYKNWHRINEPLPYFTND